MSVQALRDFINRHNASAAGLAALGAWLDAKASGAPLAPPFRERVEELLAALGAGDMLNDLRPDEVAPFLAELRHVDALEAKLLRAETRAPGWVHTEPEILQTVGDLSAGFVQPLAGAVVPSLGLADRLRAPGDAFLDVGTGVASLAIAVARTWPSVRVVGIDPWQPSLALARQNVAKSGVADRIELREQGAESLEDEAAFDLAWIPAPFMPRRALVPSFERVHRALRAGGWVLVAAINPNMDEKGAAMWRLRLTMFGEGALPNEVAEGMLRDAGFADVRTVPGAPGAFLWLIAGRKAA